MENRLQELTDKIYQEGISKANKEAEAIISEARKESEKILKEAEERAGEIVEEANRKADELINNGRSELKISFRHAANTFKQELEKRLSSAIISEPVNDALNNSDFVAGLIETLYSNWKPDTTAGAPMEVLLPDGKSDDIEKKLKKSLQKELGSSLIIKPVSRIDTGFELVSPEGGFKISVTGGDIESYLREFIRPKLIEILFEEG